jgi:hypothetical protein
MSKPNMGYSQGKVRFPPPSPPGEGAIQRLYPGTRGPAASPYFWGTFTPRCIASLLPSAGRVGSFGMRLRCPFHRRKNPPRYRCPKCANRFSRKLFVRKLAKGGWQIYTGRKESRGCHHRPDFQKP